MRTSTEQRVAVICVLLRSLATAMLTLPTAEAQQLEMQAPVPVTAASSEPLFLLRRADTQQQWVVTLGGNDFNIAEAARPTKPYFSVPNISGGFDSWVTAGGRWKFCRRDTGQCFSFHMAGNDWTWRDYSAGMNFLTIQNRSGRVALGWIPGGSIGRPNGEPAAAKVEIQQNSDAPGVTVAHLVGAPGQTGAYLALTDYETWLADKPAAAGNILKVSRHGVRIGGECVMLRDSDGQGWTRCTAFRGQLSCAVDADGEC